MNIRDRIKELRRVKAGDLAPNPLNWRTHPKQQADALRGLLAEVGFAGAVLAREQADGTLQLIDGHLRAETVGHDTEIPVLILDVTADEAAKILATYDPLGAMAGSDAEKLDELLKSVQTSSDAVRQMIEDTAEQAGSEWADKTPEPGEGGDEFDATPDESGPTRAQSGDLWVIGGKHRLIVGDNTDPENVRRLMAGETVGLCFTSPPYAQQRDYGEKAKEKVQDWHALMCGTFANLEHVMDDACQVLVNLGLVHRDGEWVPYWDEWIEWMRSQGWRRFGWYVWDQGFGLPGDWQGRFAPSFEFMFHFNRQSVKPDKTQEKQADSIGVKHGKGMRRKDGKVQEQLSSPEACLATHKIPDSVIRVNRNASMDAEVRANHPATFPVDLPAFIIESWPGDVYDPYLGSGTTLIAAHRLGRTCYGCEIEPRYADVILKRAEAEGLTCEKVD